MQLGSGRVTFLYAAANMNVNIALLNPCRSGYCTQLRDCRKAAFSNLTKFSHPVSISRGERGSSAFAVFGVAAMTTARPFEIVVWGATGTVGKLVCEHVAHNYEVRTVDQARY